METVIVLDSRYKTLTNYNFVFIWKDGKYSVLFRFFSEVHTLFERIILENLSPKICFIGDVPWLNDEYTNRGLSKFFEHFQRSIHKDQYPEQLFYMGENEKFYEEFFSLQKNAKGMIKSRDMYKVINQLLAPQVVG